MAEFNLNYIAERRKALGLTCLEMAKLLGLSGHSTYWKYNRHIKGTTICVVVPFGVRYLGLYSMIISSGCSLRLRISPLDRLTMGWAA